LISRQEITIKDIINAVEGVIEVAPCTKGNSPMKKCKRITHCAARTIWIEARDILSEFLESRTIEDMCTRAQELGVAKETNREVDFSI